MARITFPYRNLLLLTGFTALGSCGTGMLGESVSEGVVEYAMTFPDFSSDGLMAGMLPERTILSFSEGKQHLDMSAGMGVFRTGILVHSPEKRLDYHMSVLGKRMVAEMHPTDLVAMNKGQEAMTTILTNEVDTIAGYPCRKAMAVYKEMSKPPVELWYTDRIRIEDPNWFTPFSDVPGVLLRYEMVQYGIRIRMEAVAVKAQSVDEQLFRVRDDHTKVPPATLDHELAQVLGTFAQ